MGRRKKATKKAAAASGGGRGRKADPVETARRVGALKRVEAAFLPGIVQLPSSVGAALAGG